MVSNTDWDDLFNASPMATPFQSRAWHQSYAKIFGTHGLFTLRFESENRLVGLWFARRSLGRVESFANKGADYLGLLCRAGYENEVIAHWINILTQHELPKTGGPCTLNLRQIPSVTDPNWQPDSVCPYISLPNSYSLFEAQLSKNLRRDIRKANQRLTLRVYNLQEKDPFLDHLFRLHKLRWKTRLLPGVFGRKAQKLHRLLWNGDQQNLAPVMLLAQNQGTPIAALYGMQTHGRTYFYQSGFDPDFATLSPGTFLIAEAIRLAIENGNSEFDFCRGAEPYKMRWCTAVRQNGRLTKGPLAFLLDTAHSVERRFTS